MKYLDWKTKLYPKNRQSVINMTSNQCTYQDEDNDESDDSSDDDDEEDLGAECVICFTDIKDTILLPCRHFCICASCGKSNI